MKIRSKLIPIMAAVSTAAVIPAVLTTSCGVSLDELVDVPSHNMLKEYENHVRPMDPKTFSGKLTTIGKQYLNEVAYNTDVFKDDMMYSLSNSLLKSKSSIEAKCKFSKFQFNVRDIYVNSEKEALHATFESKVIGEPVETIKIGVRTITSFNLYYKFWLEDGFSVSYATPTAKILTDQKFFSLTPISSNGNDWKTTTLNVVAYGSYEYTEEGSPTKHVENDYSINQTIYDPIEQKDKYAAWSILRTVLDTISIGILDTPITEASPIVFASPYFKNAEIEVVK